MHSFDPVPVLGLVQVIPFLPTSDETADRATDFVVDALGKHAIRSQDGAGFISTHCWPPTS